MGGVKLQAKEALDYNGRHYEVGDVFEASVKDTLALRYRKRADWAPKGAKPAEKAAAPSPSIVGAGPDRSDRQVSDAFSREPSAAIPTDPDDASTESDETPRRRGRYKRRDLTPDEP